jgi:signal transduction histidine kinase
MLIVETVAVSTMVCNDLVMPTLLRLGGFGAHAGGDLTRFLLNIRRAAIVAVLMLGYLYFRIAGEAYALVSIGLISFAAVAQFAPALLGGIYWRGGTGAGALGGLVGGFAIWAYTLMLPSVAKSGWIATDFLEHGPLGIALLAPERLFGLVGLDNLTHTLLWSLSINLALYVGLSLGRGPSAREASQALLFVDVFRRGGAEPVFWRGRARLDDLRTLAGRFLGPARASALFDEHAREIGVAVPDLVADARLVDRVERQVAGAIGTASARVMVESVAQEEPLSVGDVLEILDEASQLRGYARALEETSAELRAANEALKSLDQMKDDFMSSVTHELRTPLTSIRALSELMLDTPDMELEQREEFLGIIVAESERLGRLVNQVLDMAKIESGLAEWHSEDVDLKALVAAAVKAAAELFRSKGALVETRLPEAGPVICADPDRLTQVMLNLLSNAAKFVPAGSGRVEVRFRAGGDGVVVEVADNGPGVPEADRATVFEKFRQGGDASARSTGTGLGLPISRQIVEHLGGSMWLEPEPGGGACFAFRLPLRPGGTR